MVALITDTGMRLGAAIGLLKEDIKLDKPIPHIDLKSHPWRSLKTKGSQTGSDSSDQRGYAGF